MSINLTSALDLVSDAVLARLDGPLEKVRGLPNEAYTSQAFFELEQKTLFPRCWTFAGVASELPEVGDVRPVEVAGQPLLLIRGAEREIRVFHNVCPHRGAKLIDEPANVQTALTCVYHRWSYGLDGRLRARPHYDGPGQHDSGSGGDAQDVCLFPVRSHTWHDWVFVNIDGKAPSFESYLGEAAAHFDGYDLSVLRRGRERHITTEFACNWKLAIENGFEVYHVFHAHPNLHRATDPEIRGVAQIAGRHLTVWYPVSAEGHGITPDSSTLPLPPLPGVPDEKLHEMTYIGLFPNVFVSIHQSSNAQLAFFEPVAVDRCVMHMWFYYVGDAAEDLAYRESRDEISTEWQALNAEDEALCRRIQQGRYGAYDGGRFAPYWDRGTVHIQKMVAHAVRGDGPFAPTA